MRAAECKTPGQRDFVHQVHMVPIVPMVPMVSMVPMVHTELQKPW